MDNATAVQLNLFVNIVGDEEEKPQSLYEDFLSLFRNSQKIYTMGEIIPIVKEELGMPKRWAEKLMLMARDNNEYAFSDHEPSKYCFYPAGNRHEFLSLVDDYKKILHGSHFNLGTLQTKYKMSTNLALGIIRHLQASETIFPEGGGYFHRYLADGSLDPRIAANTTQNTKLKH